MKDQLMKQGPFSICQMNGWVEKPYKDCLQKSKREREREKEREREGGEI